MITLAPKKRPRRNEILSKNDACVCVQWSAEPLCVFHYWPFFAFISVPIINNGDHHLSFEFIGFTCYTVNNITIPGINGIVHGLETLYLRSNFDANSKFTHFLDHGHCDYEFMWMNEWTTDGQKTNTANHIIYTVSTTRYARENVFYAYIFFTG